ncbi:efflux RND transporter periplasmic adaptor subunit [Candidatus Amarolinea aalborgensis]|uniref:efflux RND transporter periplasmic adaptor subunit n=1 Tax=Candidatus Amarolinea aalborgensis TaxID=2249329 RepID=UPI003BF9B395
MQQRNRIWPLALGVLVVVAAVGGFLILRGRTAATASSAATSGYTQVVEVQRGDLSASLSVVGQVEAVQQANLTFTRLSGTTKLATLDVAAGNTVTASQVLATIDPAVYRQALDQAQSDLQAAEENLADLKASVTDLARAKADLAIAKADYDKQQAAYDLANLRAPDLSRLRNSVKDAADALTLAQVQQTLAEHDASAKSERDLQYTVDWHQRRIAELQALIANGKANAEQVTQLSDEQTALGEAQADLGRVQAQRQLAQQAAAAEIVKAQVALADAQKALADAQAGGDKLAMAKAQLAVQQAQVAQTEAAENRADLDKGPDAVKLAGAQADVDKKRLAVADAEAALAGANLTAPFDGTILQTNVQAGDLVSSNTRILTVANLKTLQIVASVDETTIRQVAAGQTATITFDAFPGRTLRGRVASVPLQGTLQGDVMVYSVPITLTGAVELPLLVGMTANVKIELGQATQVLLVPTMALQRSGGLVQVLVPNASEPGGAPVAVPVEIGLSDGVNTEIVRGLNPGDKVVMQIAATQSTNPFNFRGAGGVLGGPEGGPRIQVIGR